MSATFGTSFSFPYFIWGCHHGGRCMWRNFTNFSWSSWFSFHLTSWQLTTLSEKFFVLHLFQYSLCILHVTVVSLKSSQSLQAILPHPALCWIMSVLTISPLCHTVAALIGNSDRNSIIYSSLSLKKPSAAYHRWWVWLYMPSLRWSIHSLLRMLVEKGLRLLLAYALFMRTIKSFIQSWFVSCRRCLQQ